MNISSGRHLILAIDATGNPGSIALVCEDGTSAGKVVEEVQLESPEGFGQVVFGQIDALLLRAGVGVRDVAAFAAASGPGSFTGVRIGLTAVKGLGEATGRPVIAVSNLQALASYGTASLRAAALDARRGEIYGAVYNSALQPVQEEIVNKLDSWLAAFLEWGAKLDPEAIEFVVPAVVGEGEQRVADAISRGFPAHRMTFAPRAMAGAMGKIALHRLGSQRGLEQDPAEVDANYVRRSDAEMLWSDPRAIKIPL